MVGDSCTTDFFFDLWLFDLSLNRWPTFINIQCRKYVRISDLLHSKGGSWHSDWVARLFGLDLVERVLSIMIPTHGVRDARVWRSSCGREWGLEICILYIMGYWPRDLMQLGFGG